MADFQTENNFKNKLKIQTSHIDNREAEKRINLFRALAEIRSVLSHPLISDIIPDSQEYFLNFVLVKLYFDRYRTQYNFHNIDSTINFIDLFLHIKSNFPFAFKEDENFLLNEEAFRLILRQLNSLDFNNINIGHNPNYPDTIHVDYNLEYFIFNTIYELNNYKDLLIDITQIDENDSIICNIFEFYLLRDLIINSIRIHNINFPDEKSKIELKQLLIYLLLYKVPFELAILNKIISFKPINKEIQNHATVVYIENESILNQWPVNYNLRFRGFISNFKDCLNPNNILRFTNNFSLLANLQYPVIENNTIKYNNGIYFQKQLLFKKKIIVVLQDYLTKITDREANRSKENMLSITLKADQNQIINEEQHYYLGGLETNEKNIKLYPHLKFKKSIDQILIQNQSLQLLRKCFEDLIFDNLDSNEVLETYKNIFIHIENMKNDLSYGNDEKASIEINIFSKDNLIKSKIFHPFYYRKDFLKIKLKTFQDSFIELSKVCLILTGTEIEGDEISNDELLLKRDIYSPIIDQHCIRTGNFLDITKLRIIERSKSDLNNVTLLKANDVVTTFNFSEFDVYPNISWIILPDILDNSILGLNSIAFRAISERIKPFQISEYLNLLLNSGLIYQLIYFLLPDEKKSV